MPPAAKIGWRRWLAGGVMGLAGLTAPGDLASPDDPVAFLEASLRNLPTFEEALRSLPGYAQASLESAWRAKTRREHRLRESVRTLAAALGACVLAFGILARKPWDARLLGAGILLWTALYAFDLWDGRRSLGSLPWLFAWGQALNLLCLSGLWLWLNRERKEVPP